MEIDTFRRVEYHRLFRIYSQQVKFHCAKTKCVIQLIQIIFIEIFHFAQFLPTPVFPLYWVNSLHFSDGVISIGSAIFNSAVLIGSLQISHLVKRWGNHTLMVFGVLLMSLHPLVTAFTTNLPAFLLASLIGGVAWSLVGGAVGNYLLEQVPNTDRPAYLAWYNLALNAAVLLGSLGGSWLAKEIDLSTALIVSFGIRALAAYAIWQAE